MVCLITTGDAARVAQVGEWRLGPQSFVAALAVTRRFPAAGDDRSAAVGMLARRDPYETVERALWSPLKRRSRRMVGEAVAKGPPQTGPPCRAGWAFTVRCRCSPEPHRGDTAL
jgi:hypothetical protein